MERLVDWRPLRRIGEKRPAGAARGPRGEHFLLRPRCELGGIHRVERRGPFWFREPVSVDDQVEEAVLEIDHRDAAGLDEGIPRTDVGVREEQRKHEVPAKRIGGFIGEIAVPLASRRSRQEQELL